LKEKRVAGLNSASLIKFFKDNGLEDYLPREETVIKFNRDWLIDVS
jgi:hypothetical protein